MNPQPHVQMFDVKAMQPASLRAGITTLSRARALKMLGEAFRATLAYQEHRFEANQNSFQHDQRFPLEFLPTTEMATTASARGPFANPQ